MISQHQKQEKDNVESSDEDNSPQSSFNPKFPYQNPMNKGMDLIQSSQKLNRIKTTSHFIESPYFPQYTTKFRKDIMIPSVQNFTQKFTALDIIFKPNEPPTHQLEIQLVYHSKNLRILHYEVKISYFSIKVNIINIVQHDNFKIQFKKQINQGRYGTVYQAQSMNRKFAVKKMILNNYSVLSLRDIVIEYAFMKLLAALECAPQLQRIFGFDILYDQNSLCFSTQVCISAEKYVSQCANLDFEKKFQKLQQQLLLMHSLNICHNDIKPCNILYSPSLKKIVFIDFGFTQIKSLKLGFMKEQRAKGSFYYSCQDMKKAFTSPTGSTPVDTYYNDYYALKTTKQTLLDILRIKLTYTAQFKLFSEESNSKENSKNCEQFKNNSYSYPVSGGSVSKHFDSLAQQYSDHSLFSAYDSDYFALQLMYLLAENNIEQLINTLEHNKNLNLKLLNYKFPKIYWIFLELQPNLVLQSTYQAVKRLLFEGNAQSYDVKQIVEKILDSYFKKVLIQNTYSFDLSREYIQQSLKNKKTFFKRLNFQKRMFLQSSPMNFFSDGQQSAYIERVFSQHKIAQKARSRQISFHENFIKLNLAFQTAQEKLEIYEKFTKLSSSTNIKMVDIISQSLDSLKSLKQNNKQDLDPFKSLFLQIQVKVQIDQQSKTQNTHDIYSQCLQTVTDIYSKFIQQFSISKLFGSLIQSCKQQQSRRQSPKKDSQLLKKVYFDKVITQTKKQYFEKIFISLKRLERLLSFNCHYAKSKKRIDKIVDLIKQKINELIKLKFEVEKVNFGMKDIFDDVIEGGLNFIYQVGFNCIAQAQAQEDVLRIIHYYDMIFNSSMFHNHSHLTKTPQFRLTRDVSSLIIYRLTIPKSLCLKYQMTAKTQAVLKLVSENKLTNICPKMKQMKQIIEWQYCYQLMQEHRYIEAINKSNSFRLEKEKAWTPQICHFLLKVYRGINNDRKVRQLERRLSQTKIQSFSSVSQILRIQYFLNRIHPSKVPDQLEAQKTQICNMSRKYQHNSQNSLNEGFVLENNFDEIKDQFEQLLFTPQQSMNYNLKLFYMRSLIIQSLKKYPQQDRNLVYYFNSYKKVMIQSQNYIKYCLKQIQSLKMIVSLPRFSTTRLQNTQNLNFSMDAQSLIESIILSNINNHSHQNNRSQQQQFWQILTQQRLLQLHSSFISILIENSSFIRDKSLISKIFDEFKQLTSNYPSIQKTNLQFLQIQCRMMQIQYNELKSQKCSKQFEFSIHKYLQRVLQIQKDDKRQYNFVTSQLYLIMLVSISEKSHILQGWTSQMAREFLIQFFHNLVQIKQLFLFFIDQKIYNKLISTLINIGILELKQCSQLNNYQSDYHDISSSCQQMLSSQQQFIRECSKSDLKVRKKINIPNQLFMIKIYFYLGCQINQNPCFNYTKALIRISKENCRVFSNTFSSKKLIKYNPRQVHQASIQIKTILFTLDVLFSLIIQKSIYSLVLIYLDIFDLLITSFDLFAPQICFQSCKKSLMRVIVISSQKIQYHAKCYCIQLLLDIITKFQKQNKIQTKLKYLSIKLLRHLGSPQNSYFLNQQNFRYLETSQDIQRTYEKYFKRLIVQKASIYNKNEKCQTQFIRNKFQKSIKDKIIKRLFTILRSN